jgi:hypothetical protein
LRCKEDPALCTDRVETLLPLPTVNRQYFQATKPVHSLAKSRRTVHANSQIAPQFSETQSFLHDPLNKIDSNFSTSDYQPYKDNTARQLRHLLIGSSARWFITAGLCAAYIMSTRIWVNKGPISENQKKIYNAITTALSLALGLNIASAFKDMALNMRWPILSARKRNLREVGRRRRPSAWNRH